MLSSSELSAQANIDIRNDRYPFCVVWTALPPITWIVPLIGHTGASLELMTMMSLIYLFMVSSWRIAAKKEEKCLLLLC